MEILCRYDAAEQKPIVFIADTINGEKIQVWKGEGNPQYVPLDYYRMTAPLSAADERVLLDRFKNATNKGDQLVSIRHRLPRTSRTLPNLLSKAPTDFNGTQRKAKPIEAQQAPAVQVGDLPKAGETPAPVTTERRAATQADDSASTAIWNRIQELNTRMVDLQQKIATATAELQNSSTDFDACKQACSELTVQYEKAIEEEAAATLRKRREMLAQVTSVAATVLPPPTDDATALTQAAQALHDAATDQPEEKKDEPPVAPPKARSNGGRFASKTSPAKKH